MDNEAIRETTTPKFNERVTFVKLERRSIFSSPNPFRTGYNYLDLFTESRGNEYFKIRLMNFLELKQKLAIHGIPEYLINGIILELIELQNDIMLALVATREEVLRNSETESKYSKANSHVEFVSARIMYPPFHVTKEMEVRRG